MKHALIGGILASLVAASAAADELAVGLKALRSKQYESAVAILVPLAEGGNATAQLRVGELYYHGHGVPESDPLALVWFSRAAAQGNAEAQFQSGNMYAYGLGIPREDLDADRKAAQYYFAAARQNHAGAQYALAILFLTGKGVERSQDEALKWMRRAAKGGHADAKRYVQGYRQVR